MSTINISPWLKEKIQSGEVILFLGAGATIGAKKSDGSKALTGNELRDAISDKFLGGRKKDWPLNRVADYAKNQAGLSEVQHLIKELFDDLIPSDFHKLITRFRWFSIVTTNYDLVIEKAYELEVEKLQNIAALVSDGDNFSAKISDPDTVPYLKLHGSINQINVKDLPLILASEEYAKFYKNRTRLFGHFKEWGLEHPIIFCGYDIADPNIQQILFDLEDLGINRPKYAIVKPNMDDLDTAVWSARRFEVINASFEEFIKYLNNIIPKHTRNLSKLTRTVELSVAKWFKSSLTPSSELVQYFENELQHIYKGMSIVGIEPINFYKGLENDWDVYNNNLDVKRKISEDIIIETILDGELNKPVRCCLLKGHAGSGKTVTLKRTAWDAANEFGELVFFLKEGGIIRNFLIQELYNLVQTRINLFISNVIEYKADVLNLIDFSQKNKIKINLIFGSRINEWNIYGEDLAPLLDHDFDLRDLSESEINLLLKKLEHHNCLGHLRKLNHLQRKELFKLDSERQILVALHEATSGKSFEELVFDEYNNILPEEARELYLDICTLHRLKAPVRAGLISRISGITFEKFKNQLLKPLERVVRIYEDSYSRDYVYKSRHPLIAKFVFEQVLPTPEQRQNQIIRMLRYMNVDFKWDEEAFRYLIKGRDLAELFSNRVLADQIYDISESTGANLSHIKHQRANFELNHPHGHTKAALSLIEEAIMYKTYSSKSLLHTKAMIYKKMANETNIDIEKQKYRDEAKKILGILIKDPKDAYPHSGLGQVLYDELKDKIKTYSAEDMLSQRIITNLISQSEEILSDGLQKFPEDDVLLSIQADLSQILNDEPSVIKTLEIAFKNNPRSDRIAVRLSSQYLKSGRTDDAIDVLNIGLANNPGSKRIHLLLAKYYTEKNETTNKDIISHHLKRSFTEGDTNFESHILYARHEFLYGDQNESKRIFKILESQRFAPNFRNRHLGIVQDKNKKNVLYKGYVENLTDIYCFVNSSSLHDSIFIHFSQFSSIEWEKVGKNTIVQFNLGFTVRGPSGMHASIIN